MAVKKTKYSKPSKLGEGLKYNIRFDFSAKKFFVFNGKKKVTTQEFKNAQDARKAIETDLV